MHPRPTFVLAWCALVQFFSPTLTVASFSKPAWASSSFPSLTLTFAWRRYG